MGFVENSGAHQQIGKPRSLEAMRPPLNFAHGTCPWLMLEFGPIALRKFAVESSIVGNDDIHISDESRDAAGIDSLARNHFIGNVVDGCYLGWDRIGRLVQGG